MATTTNKVTTQLDDLKSDSHQHTLDALSQHSNQRSDLLADTALVSPSGHTDVSNVNAKIVEARQSEDGAYSSRRRKQIEAKLHAYVVTEEGQVWAKKWLKGLMDWIYTDWEPIRDDPRMTDLKLHGFEYVFKSAMLKGSDNAYVEAMYKLQLTYPVRLISAIDGIHWYLKRYKNIVGGDTLSEPYRHCKALALLCTYALRYSVRFNPEHLEIPNDHSEFHDRV